MTKRLTVIIGVTAFYVAAQVAWPVSLPSAPKSAASQPASDIEKKRVEPKDYIALTLSALAFLLSLSATVITLRQKKFETERTLRSQLTDAIGKINATFESMEKLRQEKAATWNDPEVVSLKAFYNGQKLFYARQAIYIVEQIPHLVSDSEYNSIARAFNDSGDDAETFRYYEKAIAASSDAFYKSTNLRGYGRVLIRAGKVEEGRMRFQEAITLVSEDTDSAHWFRGETLQRWGQIEALREDNAVSEQLFQRASAEYSSIAFPPRRREGLANLVLARKKVVEAKAIDAPTDVKGGH